MKAVAEMSTLEQAVLVAQAQAVNMNDIQRWAEMENMPERFAIFTEKLDTRR